MGFNRCKALIDLCNFYKAPDLKSGQMLILFVLCHREIDNSGKCEISIAGIRSQTHLTVPGQIKDHLRKLRELGLISWDKTNEDLKNNHKTIRFSIHIDSETLSKTEWWKGERPDPTPDDKPPAAEIVTAQSNDKPDPTNSDSENEVLKKFLISSLAHRLMEYYGVDESEGNKVRKRLREKAEAAGNYNCIINYAAHLLNGRLTRSQIISPIAVLLNHLNMCKTDGHNKLDENGTKLCEELQTELAAQSSSKGISQ